MNWPFRVLGVAEDATSEEIRSAYHSLVRVYPPDRAPEAFSKISQAYQAIAADIDRAKLKMFGMDPLQDTDPLFEEPMLTRPHIPMAQWLAKLKDKQK